MNEAYLNINNVPTKVVTWGQWVEEDFQPNSSKDIVILIPGNPGITDFYKDFLQTIHDNTGFPVWAIGHAGHEPPHKPNIYEVPQLKGNEKLYGLEGQLQHKVFFLPSNTYYSFKLLMLHILIPRWILLINMYQKMLEYIW